MKANQTPQAIVIPQDNLNVLRSIFLFMLMSLLSLTLFAGGGDDDDDDKPKELVFKNAALESGVAGADGAIYRFAKVSSKVDALVKIKKRSDSLVRLVNIDLTGQGWDKAFQPQVTYNNNVTPAGNSNWWMEFEITYVKKGTSTPTDISGFDVTAIDIDGNNDKISEAVSFFGAESYTLETNSILNIADVVDGNTGMTGKEFSGPILNFLSIDTSGTAVMVTNSYKDVTSFSVRAGGRSTGASRASDRLYALWFKSFRYNDAMAVTLPVKLATFTATLNQQKVSLQWAVTDQQNMSHYTIERSVNGKDFTSAGMIIANDNSSTIEHYAFQDGINGIATGLIYYRLKMVNFKGDYSYSTVKLIQTRSQNNTLSIAAYPNPATSGISITLPSAWQHKKVQVMIFNQNGQVVTGLTINDAGQTETMNVESMISGMYTVRASSGTEMAFQKLIKK